MTLTVFTVVLFAAALHATWNAIVKGGDDARLTTVMVTGFAALIAALCLPFLPSPAPASWPLIGASVGFQLAYFNLIGRIYQVADMSRAYPLMRGAAPLVVAILGATVFGESLTPLAWLGVAIICTGILAMAAAGRPGESRSGLALALINAGVIAGYTLIDGAGVRRSGAPAAYTLWIFLLTGAPLGAWAMIRRRRMLQRHIVGNWGLGLLGGAGAVGSYGLALWAMTLAPIATVAALRETSILFAVGISGLVLNERVGTARIAAACVIAAGAIVLRLT